MLATARDEFSDKEFPMTEKNFGMIKAIAYKLTGISLSDHKKNMVYGRLARRLRALRLNSFDQYCALIDQENCSEHVEFINSITTNLTSFFREKHHFDFMAGQLLPQLMRKNLKTKRLRVWSAGCSTGEEPYSIAMVLRSLASLSGWDVRILATDLDTNVVNKGKNGVYPVDRAENIPDEYRRFLKTDKNHEWVRVKSSVCDLITFKQLNLLQDWPMKGPFDIIFCRNVVIYFDAPTQKKLFDRYANILTDDGHLFIGHSENLHNVTNRFQALGRTIYKKAH
ncbi:chemotaxis protein methyltransferase [Teredinibacter turnerae T7901]|uniref:Chemotaxis protein methyltransferase n=2 Tax=Teredinibacter turnerae TaxID=2426 RepID=C5BSF2_TERTT|nr:protein-glutamate O-methyltransferase CheR [Teredinibacter turnerae]ACR11695.1 chemotaxis protein methyltransferase [Teredinibacter turnerae T7901]